MKWLAVALALLLSPKAAPAEAEAPLAPDWVGSITSNGLPLRIALHFGAITTIDSLDQNVKGLAATSTRQGGNITVESPALHGRFDLTLSADGQVLTGTLTQGGHAILATLHPGLAVGPARPQTPSRPYPYREEEVRYPNPSAPGVVLAGTLTLPQGKGPFPAVLLITGSGPQDRDETVFDHKPFLVIADNLTRRGIAVLRLDDRGMGGSTGDPDPTLSQIATDVEAGVAWLKTQATINSSRIGLIGHSDGGAVATMVAAKDSTIAYLVLLAGPGVRGAELVAEQNRLIDLAAGYPQATADADYAQKIKWFDAVAASPNAAAAQSAARQMLAASGATPAQIPGLVAQIAAPSMYERLAYDPTANLRTIKVPILALDGSKDLQVPAKLNLPAVKAANPKAETVELQGLNHLFQTAKTGSPQEYGQIQETFAPAALALLSDWVIKVTSQPWHGTAHRPFQ